ncbi:MAG: nucleotidyl transferase AbiEii/AbiGii toxin family protein [Lachnospiraceae bacterium]
MNLMDEVDKIKHEGYSEANAEAKLCQDIIISAISRSSLNQNVTIKGGVVMRSLSGEVRRATQDIDLDFIRYSISEESIKLFVEKLNCLEGIQLKIEAPIEELKHQDYKGKRIYIEVSDSDGNVLSSKMDIGVHKDLDIEQEEYCFDICYNEESASVLINSKSQMITEKLKSMIRFGTRSTRYKDVFDICYLSDLVDRNQLQQCIQKYILSDVTLGVTTVDEVKKRAERLFTNSAYKKKVEQSRKNWLDMSVEEVIKKDLEFIQEI